MRSVGRAGRRFLAMGAILALLFVLLPATAHSAQGGDKLSREVEEKIHAAGPDDLLAVIIQTADEPTSAHCARLHGRGGVVKTRHESFHG